MSPDRDEQPKYGEGLRLPDLLDVTAQVVASLPTRSSEAYFFVAVHHATELWFSVLLHELEIARAALAADDVPEVCYRMRRVASVDRVLVATLPSLETISPRRFGEVRSVLGSASGLQSTQFREIEFVSGLKQPNYLDRAGVTDDERRRLRRRLDEPSIAEMFDEFLVRRGVLDLSQILGDGGDHQLSGLVDALIEHDQEFAVWRARHAEMVARVIGSHPGTGGSSGVGYLRSRVPLRFFPQIWAALT